jgi:hypothetical protein
MKLSAEAKGLERLKKRLVRRAPRAAPDALLRAAAQELRREAVERFADASGMSEAEAARFVRVEPAADGAGYSVVADAPEAWDLEFGSRARTAATAWFTRALTAALPAMKRAIGGGRIPRGESK